MKKLLLSFAAIALSIGSAQAGVAINETNFPDENMLWAMQAIDDNDEEWGHNGILDDEEIGAINDYFLSLSGVANFKGIEYFYDGLKHLLITGLNAPDVPTTNLDLTKFKVLETLEIGDYADITSLDFTNNTKLRSVFIATMPSLTTVQFPASMELIRMYWCPKLTTVNLAACRENLDELHMLDVGIQDVDVSNFKKLHRIYIEGNDAENIYKLNSLNIAGCDELWSISIQCTDIETLTIKDLPVFDGATVSYNDIRKLIVENCPKLIFLDCQDNKLPELHIKKCEAFYDLEINKLGFVDPAKTNLRRYKVMVLLNDSVPEDTTTSEVKWKIQVDDLAFQNVKATVLLTPQADSTYVAAHFADARAKAFKADTDLAHVKKASFYEQLYRQRVSGRSIVTRTDAHAPRRGEYF